MDVSPKRDFMIEIPGGAAFVLGLVVLFGWVLDMPLLAYIDPDWKPMAPGTALCFAIGGLALLASASKAPGILRARARGLLIGMVLLLAGARGVELLLTSLQQTAFTAPLWVWLYENQGQMSIPTVFGFLAFAAGFLQLNWGKTPSCPLFARLISITLIVLGLASSLSYIIQLHYLFEPEFLKTGLIWLSLPTAIVLTLLGLGLWGVVRQHEWPGKQDKRAGQIYRATVMIIVLTTLVTGVVGIIFLEEATLAHSKTAMTQTLETKQAHLASLIEDHVERALLASTDPTLMTSVHGLLQNIRQKGTAHRTNTGHGTTDPARIYRRRSGIGQSDKNHYRYTLSRFRNAFSPPGLPPCLPDLG